MDPRYPSAAAGTVRLSQSAIETYLRCGYRWEFDREAHNRRIRYLTVPMAIGSAVARGAEVDNATKIAEGRGAPTADIVEASVVAYERDTRGAEIPESKSAISGGKDDAAAAARAFAMHVSVAISDVVECESPIAASVGYNLELVGTPDYVTADGIGDLKTGQPWTEARVHASRQLTAYSILHAARYGALPRRVWIDSMYRTRSGWDYIRIPSDRTENSVNAYLAIVESVRANMAAGATLPAPEGAWWCSPRWCPHWDRCPAV